MNAFTNGRHFTDEYGYLTIPVLCDEFGEPEALSHQHDSLGHCHVCSKSADLNFVTYPCVLRSKRIQHTSFYGYDDWNGVYHPGQVMAETEFALCDECKAKADILLKTSDHISLGHDWWDILDGFEVRLSGYQLPTSSHPHGQFVRRVAKTMCVLEDGVNGESGPLTVLPTDWLTLMVPKVMAAFKENAGELILRTYKKWRADKWRENDYSGDEASHSAHYYDTRHTNVWAHCDDCGATHRCGDLRLTEACASDNCCYKRVCYDGCSYICRSCGGNNRVDRDVHERHHDQLDDSTEVAERRVTPWICYHCNNTMTLNRCWDPAVIV